MTTFAELQTAVSRDLSDPANLTFSTDVVKDIINVSLAEVGRIAPRRFSEDVDPVENSFEYQLLTADFSDAVPEIEVSRVELWDTTTTPHRPLCLVPPGSQGYTLYSDTGWHLVDGILEVPYRMVVQIGSAITDYLIKVWGYAPYVPLVADDDVVPVSNEREWALRAYCRVEALQRLLAERDLFTQWQTRSGNSDMTPGGLMNALTLANEDWRRRSRAITVLRETAG